MQRWLLFKGLLLSQLAFAQDQTVKKLREEAVLAQIRKNNNDTTQQVWKRGGLFNLNIAQSSLTNWAAGGDKSAFSATGYLNLFAYYQQGKHGWDNSLNLAYGMINTTSLGKRKSDDRLDLVSKYGYKIGRYWYLSSLISLRTQLANGYAYPAKDSSVLISKGFSPVYIILSLGFDCKPNDHFSLFFSAVTSRWVVVGNQRLGRYYGIDSGNTVRHEIGAFLSANFNATVMENISCKSKLDLFSNYKKDPQNIDVVWTNLLTLKVNQFISANITLDMLYDNDIQIPGETGPRLQVKEVLAVGISAKF